MLTYAQIQIGVRMFRRFTDTGFQTDHTYITDIYRHYRHILPQHIHVSQLLHLPALHHPLKIDPTLSRLAAVDSTAFELSI